MCVCMYVFMYVCMCVCVEEKEEEVKEVEVNGHNISWCSLLPKPTSLTHDRLTGSAGGSADACCVAGTAGRSTAHMAVDWCSLSRCCVVCFCVFQTATFGTNGNMSLHIAAPQHGSGDHTVGWSSRGGWFSRGSWSSQVTAVPLELEGHLCS